MVIFLMGVIGRQLVGPEVNQDYISICGKADELSEDVEECKLHYLYSEEFFGSVQVSMMTVFRCLMGECNSRAGQSLTVHFSQGFGARFNIIYIVGIITVIFGLFNAITAIF